MNLSVILANMSSGNLSKTHLPFTHYVDIDTLAVVFYIIHALYLAVGGPLGLFMLFAIASSKELRSTLRNKVLLSLITVEVAAACILSSLAISYFARFFNKPWTASHCHLISVIWYFGIVVDCISNWAIVVLLGIFLVSALDLDVQRRLSPNQEKTIHVCLPMLPWVLALIVMPTTAALQSVNVGVCSLPHNKAWLVFMSVNSVVPLGLDIVLLAVTFVQQRRWRRNRSNVAQTAMSRDLIGGKEVTESVLPYVGIFAAAFVLDFAENIDNLFYDLEDWIARFYFSFAAYFLQETRTIVLPLVILLLPDVRQRIKTWRPWIRTVPQSPHTNTVRFRK